MAKIDTKGMAIKYTTSLVDPIKNATSRGAWGGVDGAQQYIKGDRLQMLKSFGEKYYNEGLELCLNTIIVCTIEKHNNQVLKEFAKEHPKFMLHIIKNKPDIFINKEILRCCFNALNDKDQREFFKHASKLAEKGLTLNSDMAIKTG